MNRDQANAVVEQTFTQAFDKGRFAHFCRNLVNHLDESKAGAWNSQYVKDAFKDHVQRYERIGTYTSPTKETLDVLVVHLTQESKLERARTGIRNFVADHLKSRDEKDSALVAFVSPSENSWRFSFVKMEYVTVEQDSGRVGVKEQPTPARRFSYIVGVGESCHTAQTRFLDLLQDATTDPALSDIEEAFSVEAVTKEFFTRYADLFGEIHAALDKLINRDKTLAAEFTAKDVNPVDFAKKLMGQIVFLYFLQKKGWLGVAKGEDWGRGPHDFLRRLANHTYVPYDNFFNDILEPLFYDTLATDRGHEAWSTRFKCRIPFLNGGLFEPPGNYNWRKTDIILPNKLFTNKEVDADSLPGTGVLDVFDRYNFTVNEAEPLEKEVAIDPEMLGKVFENLIEDNRRKGLGAYYTPREIVHYMCQESLINYLDTAINGTDPKGSVPRTDLETFVHLGEQISHYEAVAAEYKIKMPRGIEKHARLIDDKLADITICDPAVGSGAFPVGMMTEIVRARLALTNYFNDVHERTAYHFKRHAIQHCLYGVDIDAGAVEIAKLRLWLSLVVDEEDVKQIKPLPNLDYKIVAGNSLLGFRFKSQRVGEVEKLKERLFDETDRTKKAELKAQVDRLLAECFAASKKSLGYEVNFDFQIFFSEVFQRKGGFDVMLGNPPYDVLNVTEGQKINRDALSQLRHMETYKNALGGKLNLFRLFIAKGLELLGLNSHMTYIIPYGFMCDSSSKNIREYILANKQLIFIEAFPERDDPNKRLFENAKMSTCIILVRNAKTNRSFVVRTQHSRQISDDEPIVHLDFDSIKRIDETNYSIPLTSDAELHIVKKIISGENLRVKDIGRCYEGEINLTFHKKYLQDNRDSNAKLIKGAAVQRYVTMTKMSQGQIQFLDSKAFLRAFDGPKTEHHRMKRIIMQGMTGVNERIRLKMTLLDEDAFCGNSVNYILLNSDRISYEYLLAILNSQLLNWYFKLFSTNSNVNGYEVDSLPIKQVSPGEHDRYTKLVGRIIAAKKGDPSADTSALEREIDRLVYRLYDLTPAEIDIVEASVRK